MRWSLLGRDDKQARRVACFLLLSLPCPPFRALGMEVRRCRVCSAVVVTADGSHELTRAFSIVVVDRGFA